MKIGNYQKMNRIRETEEVIRRIHSGIQYYCSNEHCKNKVVLSPEESKRVIMCSKCYAGTFIKKKKKPNNLNNINH